MINDSGKRVNDYWYTPFGDYAGGDSANASAGVPWVPWRFTGEWFDGVSVDRGYYKIGLRYYDHAMNRWTQADPVERVVNPMQPAEAQPYTYAGTNPTNQTDPTGAYSWEEFGGDVLTALAGVRGCNRRRCRFARRSRRRSRGWICGGSLCQRHGRRSLFQRRR